MILIDVNVLVYAHRVDARDHLSFKSWLAETLRAQEMIGMSDLVLSAVVRILTHPRIFREPTHLLEALSYVDSLRRHPASVPVNPGSRHWDIFVELAKESGVKGALITDTYFAALAIESGAEWITTDRDFARFPGLRWRHPLA